MFSKKPIYHITMNLKQCRMASDTNNEGNIITKLCLTNILYKLKNYAT